MQLILRFKICEKNITKTLDFICNMLYNYLVIISVIHICDILRQSGRKCGYLTDVRFWLQEQTPSLSPEITDRPLYITSVIGGKGRE
jgi:hypothetical protein